MNLDTQNRCQDDINYGTEGVPGALFRRAENTGYGLQAIVFGAFGDVFTSEFHAFSNEIFVLYLDEECHA